VADAAPLLRADAAFEVGLGVGLIGAALRGSSAGVPTPAPLVGAFGAALLPLAGVLFAEAGRRRGPRPWFVVGLAAVNGAYAASVGAWLAARRSSFSPVGAVVAGGSAVVLGGLGAAELAAAR
jgi:hypothetical protein